MRGDNSLRRAATCGMTRLPVQSSVPRARAAALAVASCFAGYSHANPVGPQVISGTATFQAAGKTLNITNSSGAVINWQGFSIGADEVTRFLQGGAASSVLNRVTGGESSNILGQLLSNGRVFLINPNGVFIGGGAVVDVAGFVASSLNLSDADFLAGKFKFSEQIGAGRIVNQGTIQTSAGGQVYLVAPNVENHGVITSPTGEVILAAGKSVELVQATSPYLRVELTASENDALNVGKLLATSGRVGIFGATVRNSGTVSANAASIDATTGKIVFRAKKDVTLDSTSVVMASGAKGGEVTIQAGEKNVGGTLLADGVVEAKGAVDKGGTLQMLGDRVGLVGHALVDASGAAGGGTVLVGGDFQGKNPEVQNAERTYVGANVGIRADAGKSGDGGKVIVWADDSTRFYGAISARGGAQVGNGGFAEVSGKNNLQFLGNADLSAANGRIGSLLLDPTDIVIEGGNGASSAVDDVNGFDDPGASLTITEAILEASSASVSLQAKNSITVSGTFGQDSNGEGTSAILRMQNNASLTMETRNASGEGTGGINLTGSTVEIQTQGSGNIVLKSGVTGTGAGGAGATPISTGVLTTLGTGSITTQANGSITVSGGLTTNGGAVTLTSTTGSITSLVTSGNITTTAAVNSGTISGVVSLDAAANISLAGNIVTTGANNGAGGGATAGQVDISTAGGTIAAKEITASGGTGTTTAGSAAAINVTTVGTTKDITLNGVLTALKGAAGTGGTDGTVTLTATGSVSDAGAGSVAAGQLLVLAGKSSSLSNAVNDVVTMAAAISGSGQSFIYEDANAVAVGTVGSTNGITTNGGNVTVRAGTGNHALDVTQPIVTLAGTAATAGGAVVLEAGGAISLSSSGTITTTGNTSGAGGAVFIHHTNAAAGDITLGKNITATGGNAGNGGAVSVLNDSGKVLVQATVDVSGAGGTDGSIRLKASGEITDNTSGSLVGDTNGVLSAYSTGGKITLTQGATVAGTGAGQLGNASVGHQMATVAFKTDTASGTDGSVSYLDRTVLTVGSVTAGEVTPVAPTNTLPSALGAVSGVTTVAGGTDGAVRLRAGVAASNNTLTVSEAINTQPAGNGSTVGGAVVLESGGAITTSSAGTITTTGQASAAGLGGVGGEVFIHHTNLTSTAGAITLGGAITASGGAAAVGGTTGGNGGVVTLLNERGGIVVNAALSANGGAAGSGVQGNGGTVQLVSTGTAVASTITQGAAITATGATGGNLKVTASDDVTLQNTGNDVAKLAASITSSGKSFKYTDANTLAIDQVVQAGSTGAVLGAPSGTDAQQVLMNGIATLGAGSITLISSGSLTLNQNISSAGSGSVALKALGATSDIVSNGATVSSSGGGNLQAIAGRGILATTATGTTAEYSTSGTLLLSAGNGIGSNANGIDIAVPTVAASITSASAGGDIYLNQLNSGGNLVVGTATGLDGSANLSGITTSGSAGSVSLTIGSTNTLTVSQPIVTTGTGNVSLVHASALNVNADVSASGSVNESGGGAVAFGGTSARTLSATNGNVTFNDSVTTSQPLVVNAGTGGSNGLISINAGLASGGNDVELNGRNWALTASPVGSVDAGSGVLRISHATNGTINLSGTGGGSGSVLDTANLSRITSSGTLVIGDAAFGDTVNVAGSADLAASTPNVLIQAASVTQGAGRIGTPNTIAHLLSFSTANGASAAVSGITGTANIIATNSATAGINLDIVSGNAHIAGPGPSAAINNSGGGVDLSVQNGTLTIASGGGGIQATGDVVLRSSSDMSIDASVQSSSGSATLVAGRASGMGASGIGQGTWGVAAPYQVSSVAINAPIRAGYTNMNGNVSIFATGPVSQTNTADAGLQAFHSNAFTQGNLKVVTFNDATQAAKITLENDRTGTSNPGAIGDCGSPAVSGTGNCAGPLTLETRFADGRVNEFAASDIKYKSINGTTIFGVGTAANVQFISPSHAITSGNINGKNVFFYATGGDIDLNVQIKNSDINVGNSGGSLNLIADGNININSPTDGAKAGVSIGRRTSVLANGSVIAEPFDHDLKLSATGDINLTGSIYMKGDLALRADASSGEVVPLAVNPAGGFGDGNGSIKLVTSPLTHYTTNTPVAVFPLEIKAKNIVVGSRQGGRFPVKDFTLDASQPLAASAGIEQRADAVVEASGNLEIYLSGDLTMKSGNAVAITTGRTLRNTAVTALIGADVIIKGIDLGGGNASNISLKGGTASTTTSAGGGAIAAADALLLATNSKDIDVGGSITLEGGVTPVNGQSTAVAKIDPNVLKIKSGGDLVLIGGTGVGSTASIVNDGNIELTISGRGSTKSYNYSVNGVAKSVNLPGGLVLIGGPGTGLYGANDLSIGLGDQIQASFPGGGSLSTYSTSGLAAAFITANSPRAYDNLLNYIIYAANEETRAGRLRAGLGAGDDSNLPTCN